MSEGEDWPRLALIRAASLAGCVERGCELGFVEYGPAKVTVFRLYHNGWKHDIDMDPRVRFAFTDDWMLNVVRGDHELGDRHAAG